MQIYVTVGRCTLPALTETDVLSPVPDQNTRKINLSELDMYKI